MHATKQDWGKVLETLRDFQDRYPTRRTKEANYLEGKNEINTNFFIVFYLGQCW
jgi:hypothetical protein